MTPKRTLRRYTAAPIERQPLAELAVHYQLVTGQTIRWKLQLREQAAQVFADAPAAGTSVSDAESLYAVIGRLQTENVLLKSYIPQ